MTEQASQILELDSVSKKHAAVEGEQGSIVLDGISLSVPAGESLSIMGPSGSGKSTLLNIMGGLDRPTGGRVLLEGTDLAGCDDGELARIRRERVGFVFQVHHLLPQCSALENVLVPVLAGDRKSTPDEIRSRAITLLERVGLGHRLSHKPGLLSGGERPWKYMTSSLRPPHRRERPSHSVQIFHVTHRFYTVWVRWIWRQLPLWGDRRLRST